MQIPFYNIKYKKCLYYWYGIEKCIYLSLLIFINYALNLKSSFFFFRMHSLILFPGWHLTLDTPSSASLELEVQACATLLDGSWINTYRWQIIRREVKCLYTRRSQVTLWTYWFILNRTWPVKCKHGQRRIFLGNCMERAVINWDSGGESTEVSLQNNAVFLYLMSPGAKDRQEFGL